MPASSRRIATSSRRPRWSSSAPWMEAGSPPCRTRAARPGFIRVTGPNELIFPSYDGNGMFLSLGNLGENPRIGLLFIDFEHPNRLRVHGRAALADDPALLGLYPGADHVVRVTAEQIFVNCGRYIHQSGGATLSPHLPDASGQQPFPAWKRIDIFEGALPEGDDRRWPARAGRSRSTPIAARPTRPDRPHAPPTTLPPASAKAPSRSSSARNRPGSTGPGRVSLRGGSTRNRTGRSRAHRRPG